MSASGTQVALVVGRGTDGHGHQWACSAKFQNLNETDLHSKFFSLFVFGEIELDETA
jgi:hypothetical protein